MNNEANCPDCGTEVGEPHHDDCHVQQCSVCGERWITCVCEDHDPAKSAWTGQRPEYVKYVCDECGKEFEKGDGIVDGIYGDYWCDACLDNRRYVCERCGAEFLHDDGTADDLGVFCNACTHTRFKQPHDDCGTESGEPQLKEKPAFLGVAVLARKDHTRPFSIDNCIWRTAVSEEEAQVGREIYVGAELRNRLLELEKQGWIQISDDGRTLLDSSAASGEGATA